MPFLVGLAAAIAAALGITVTALVVATAAIVGAILTLVGTLTGIQALQIAGMIVGFSGFVYNIGVIATHLVALHGLSLMTAGRILLYGTLSYVRNLQMGLHAIAGATHFYLALKIHRIAWLVSPQYRQMIQKLTHNLMSLSRDLGWGVSTMLLLFNDARNLVLSVSGLLGRSYDLAQVVWLSRMKDILTWVDYYLNKRAFTFNLFLDLLDNFVFKPYTTATANWIGGVVTTVQSALNSIEAITMQVQDVRNALQELLGDIPYTIGTYVSERLEPVFKQFDEIINVWITPNIQRIDEALGELVDTTDDLRQSMSEQLRRLLYPAGYLSEIDKFSGVDRRWQEDVVGDFATRSYRRINTQWMGYISDEYDRWQRIIDALKSQQHPPAWAIAEVPGLQYPRGIEPQPRKTWNVGDY
ncbi:MAG: hypothetical protein ACE5K8_10465 [Candidatus Zixiibacteriota bacterium]